MATARDLEQPAVYDAPENAAASTARLLGGIVGDIRELVSKELALARQETVEEIAKAKTAVIALATAGAVLAMGGLLLVLALAQGLADLLDWPAWAGYGIVGLVFGIVGYLLISMAQKRFKQIHPVPEKTVETVKENVEWLKQRTTGNP